ncbi:MAG: cell division protein ZapA [Bacteroidales bacterium]|nr:cell division protein ZapA [Bacteroidales bacterium]MBP5373956.1 cell division protein ZapA [Bacteroidales bacterium]
MEQKISIKIAGRTYNLSAATPEQEQLYRLGADAVNKRLAALTQKMPGKTAMDLMSMVAMNEAVVRIRLQKDAEKCQQEINSLESDLVSYLKQ